MTLDSDEQAALDLHNQARREAPGAPRRPLIWDDYLGSDAEAWAIQTAYIGDLQHASQTSQGENLYRSSGAASFLQATQAWLNEKVYYHGQVLSTGRERGDDMTIEEYSKTKEYETQWRHYSAMIWLEARRVGMGCFQVPDDGEWEKPGSMYVVAGYDVMQIEGRTAWRLSRSNPYGYCKAGWEEEKWILKYGRGKCL